MSEPTYRCGKCGGSVFLVMTDMLGVCVVRCEGERGYGVAALCTYEQHAPSLTAAFVAISRKEPEAKT